MAIIEELAQEPKATSPTNIHPPSFGETNLSTSPLVVGEDLFYDSEQDTTQLLAKSTHLKQQGNICFGQGDYEQALQHYQDASLFCPDEQQQAIYASNMAACHLKLGRPQDAKAMCDTALDLDPTYLKARFRRAQANERIATSASLSDGLKDYQDLLQQDIDPATRRACQRAAQDLPPRIKSLMEKEKEEMMAKLKDLGNTVLGKFGLSVDNFQFQQDPTSGNYTMNFVNQPSSSSS
ncbi:uncharacterized protein BX664DRAFT_333050 [Halteromyces radiatus]|uniref:uncharacterized protein n=1 Tax=Halteromyces radiatus TaxID=101107 RepID=UPI00221FB726|nr:uncharacterized protein BX664DRAFT_333050 [Halteromyces radiatus]KAI8089453.1 hypothetical protein BX664DRAFT_333050 [Halteromyces radiatus]